MFAQPKPGVARPTTVATTHDHKEVLMKTQGIEMNTQAVNLQPATNNRKKNCMKKQCNNALRLAVLLAMAILTLALAVPSANAQTTVGYLQQKPLGFKGPPQYQIPPDPASGPASKWVGAGYYGPFNLPGYSDVYVDVSPDNGPYGDVPELTWGHETPAQLQSTSNRLYDWGTDTDFLHFYNTSASTNKYKITFYFDAVSAPNTSDLFVVVLGLANGTTATVSPGTGTNVGEYTLPETGLYSSTSKTAFKNGTFSSGWYQGSGTDPKNTGWDLYQPPKSKNLRVLSLDVTQLPGDGMGFTLGYRVCSTLVGNSLDPDNGFHHLYDINTTTGIATNPRVIGSDWSDLHIGFSRFSPSGTLYALQVNGDLFTVDPSTGAATLVAATGYSTNPGGGLAADPTTGILYGVDIWSGILFTVSAGGVVAPVGTVGTVPNEYFRSLSAMAFDHNGNLFIVDSSNGLLLKVDKNNPLNVTSKPLTFPPSLPPYPWGWSYAGLAIGPSGTAYYTQLGAAMYGDLYTLNLSTGILSPIGKVAGAEDSGILASLTFIESLVDRSGACPFDYNGPPN